nr:hypothetical protein [Tanacetum cinerariifolium]
MPELLEDETVEAIRIRAKWENDDYICRGHILNGISDSLFYVYTNVELAKELWDSLESNYMAEDSSSKKFLDFKHTLKHGKDDLSLIQLGSHLCIEESLRAQDSDKGKGKEVGGPSVNMTKEGGKNKHHKQNKGKKRSNENNSGSSSNKKPKLEYSGATTHICKDRCWFKTYEPMEDGFVLYMGDDHLTPVHCKGSVALEFSFGKTITFFNVLYVPKLRKNLVSDPMLNKCGYKQVYESDKYILSKSDSVYMSSSTIVNSSLCHARLGHVHYKRMLEMYKDDLIPAIYENLKKCTTCNKNYVISFIDDASRFCYVYLLHAKDEALNKFRIYKTEVELQQNDLVKTLRTDRGGEYYDPIFFQSVGIIHETTAPYIPQQNGMAERKNGALKEMVNSMLSYSGLKSRDAIFDENHFSLIPRLKDIIPNSNEYQRNDHSDDVPNEIPKPRKGIRVQKAKSYGSDFQLYLVEGSRDHVRVTNGSSKGRLKSMEQLTSLKLDWGCAISWASKKQTCITGSTMESEFLALAAADDQIAFPKKICQLAILFMMQMHSSCKFSRILNHECDVLPDGSSSDAIPEDATASTILSSE